MWGRIGLFFWVGCWGCPLVDRALCLGGELISGWGVGFNLMGDCMISQNKMPKTGSTFLWIGIFLFLFGAIFLFAGYHMFKQEQEYANNSETVTGTVTGKHIEEKWDTDSSTKKRTKTTYHYLNYKFTPYAQAELESSGSVSSDVFKRHNSGDKIDIQYVKDDFTKNRVASEASYVGPILFCVIGGVILLVGAGILSRHFKKKSLYRRLYQNGVKVEAVVESIDPTSLSINNITQYKITCSFHDIRGQKCSAVSEYMHPDKAHLWKLGDKAHVLYDKDNSAVNVLEEM